MSMIGNLRRLSDADLSRLLAEPSLISDYLYSEDEEDASDPPFGEHADLDIDKAWHGIHFLLTRSAWEGELPLAFLVCGGTEIGDEDVGYGPARGFDSEQVRAIAKALEAIDPIEFRARFDPAAMTKAQVYPEIWNRPLEQEDTVGYLVDYYDEMRSFIAGAAKEGEALLVYLN